MGKLRCLVHVFTIIIYFAHFLYSQIQSNAYIRREEYDDTDFSDTYIFRNKLLSVSDFQVCAKECNMEQKCISFLYHHNSNSCEVLNTKLFNSLISSSQSGNESSYFEKNAGCNYTWMYYNGHCYKKLTQALNWTNANISCQNENAYLVAIDTSNENSWIRMRLWSGGCYTGALFSSEHNAFLWSGGQTMSFTNWGDGEPNNVTGDSDCMIFKGDGSGQWNDVSCYYNRCYICEKPFFH